MTRGVVRADGGAELARDAFGTKALCFATDHGRLIFASEPAAVLAEMIERPRVDPISIDDVLAFGWTERRRTGYEEIERLLPGETAVYRAGRLERRPVPEPPGRSPTARGSLAGELERSVRACVDDGPVGILLTGAAGDAALVEASSRAARGPITTFAATFEGGDGAGARAAAGLQGAKHREIPLVGKDLPKLVEALLVAQDSPFADPELVRAHVLCKAAREEVAACLSTDGSDEILGAGARHRRMRSVIGQEEERRYASTLVATEARLRKRLFTKGRRTAHRKNESERELWNDLGIAGSLDARMLRHDLRHALPNRVLERARRAAAASNLELAFPFVDRALVENVPPGALDAAPSPEVPIDRWMRTELAPLVDGYLVGSRLAAHGWLSEPAIAAVLRAHRASRARRGRTLFALLALEIWYRKRILRI